MIYLLWTQHPQPGDHRLDHAPRRPRPALLGADPAARPARADRRLRRRRRRAQAVLVVDRARPAHPHPVDRPRGTHRRDGRARPGRRAVRQRHHRGVRDAVGTAHRGPASGSGRWPSWPSSPTCSCWAARPCSAARPATSTPATSRTGSPPRTERRDHPRGFRAKRERGAHPPTETGAVTPSGADDPLDPHVSAATLHEARSRLLLTARAVQRAWLLAVGSTFLLAIGAAALFAISLFVSPTYVLIWTVLLSAALWNVTRYWPQTVEAAGVTLSAEEVRRLRHGLDPHAPTWPDTVHLVPDPDRDRGRPPPHAGHAAARLPGARRPAPPGDARVPGRGDGRGRRRRPPGPDPVRRPTSAASMHVRRRATARPRGLSGRIQAALGDFRIEHERWLPGVPRERRGVVQPGRRCRCTTRTS